MKITTNGINIELEQDEIVVLWNVIMFARDYHSLQEKQHKFGMNQSELKLCQDLLKVLDEVK